MISVDPRRLAVIVAAAVLASGLGAQLAKAQVDELPDAPGKDDVTQICTQCHAAGLITQRRRTAEEWAEIMVRMKGLGAMMDDDTQATILGYLDANLGKPSAPAQP